MESNISNGNETKNGKMLENGKHYVFKGLLQKINIKEKTVKIISGIIICG